MNMNINGYTAAVNAYMYNPTDGAARKITAPAKSRNTDRAEFSAAARAASAQPAEGLTDKTSAARSSAAGAADSTASSERITALKNAVASGTYFVPAGDIASAVLAG